MNSKKKRNLSYSLTFGGLGLFILSMLGFVVDACTAQNVPIAWVFFALIFTGLVIMFVGIVLLIVFNRVRIKAYFKEIMNSK